MISLDEIRRARERIGDDVLRTPLVPLGMDDRIRLKLECLQPIGCFACGALSAVQCGVVQRAGLRPLTASAGNMAQGVAWAARGRCAARVIVPRARRWRSSTNLLRSARSSSCTSHEEWWQAMVDHRREGVDGLFIHPSGDEAVMAGNGTIGLETARTFRNSTRWSSSWGGGGLTSGIASATARRCGRAFGS